MSTRNKIPYKVFVTFILLHLNLFIHHLALCQSSSDSLFLFPLQPREIGCMRHFNPQAPSNDLTNAYFLAKFSETLYPERLDLQIRMQQNQGNLPKDLISTDELKIHPRVTDTNYLQAFKARFQHYFDYDYTAKQVNWEFLEKSALDTTGIFTGHVVLGQDPECMIISTPSYVLIIFRGTDDIRNNRFAEWIGTDFNAFKTRSDSTFENSRIHKGFYKSFQLIEGDLKKTLELFETKNKPIWLAGHSLGGAMAVISGISLAQEGYNIAGVCSFGGPSVIGNRRFSKLTDSLLKEKIQRYEYKLDPVSILSAPGYKTFGQRNWITRTEPGKYLLYSNAPERSFFSTLTRIDTLSSKQLKKELFSSRLSKLPYQLYHHNTQWIVKGIYFSIPLNLREHLPLPEDTFPLIYYAWDISK